MFDTKEQQVLLKDVGFLMKVEKYTENKAKKATNTKLKRHYHKLFVETGVLMNEVVKILSPKVVGDKKPYNIIKEIKKVKEVARKKGYDK